MSVHWRCVNSWPHFKSDGYFDQNEKHSYRPPWLPSLCEEVPSFRETPQKHGCSCITLLRECQGRWCRHSWTVPTIVQDCQVQRSLPRTRHKLSSQRKEGLPHVLSTQLLKIYPKFPEQSFVDLPYFSTRMFPLTSLVSLLASPCEYFVRVSLWHESFLHYHPGYTNVQSHYAITEAFCTGLILFERTQPIPLWRWKKEIRCVGNFSVMNTALTE